ncbi:DUF4275 family protein [Exiguobacterium sp. s150]|uniref:DUF4275 family protein n=1 Tax=Exiguobacterium sp. s150 TaxID=2751221 RepID=UPI001BE53EB5|nr:DUF4275 family protein [Exiguobacterium sp. s150]
MDQLIKQLTDKRVDVMFSEEGGKALRERWRNAFLEDGRQVRPFLWEHLVGRFLGGAAAEDAFNHAKTWKCYLFFESSPDIVVLNFNQSKKMNRNDFTVRDGEYADVYIVDEHMTWTYVVPHEQEYGPYFIKRLEE